MTSHATDCLVLGGGLSGWMAARELVRAGHTVALVREGAGASPWVHGFNVPLLPEDSPAHFLADTLRSGHGICDPALARALCMDAPLAFEAMRDLGLHFNRDANGYQLLRPLGASFPRVASIGNETGVAILKSIRATLQNQVLEIPHARAVRLLTEGRRVTGALVFDKKAEQWLRMRAKAVVLACGGFCGIYPVSTNKYDAGGDGIAMAFEAGAPLRDMEFIQFEPSAAVWPKALVGTSMITTMFYQGAVLRNRSGDRFMLQHDEKGECVNKDILSQCIAAEIAAGRGTDHQGVYFDATAVGRDVLAREYPSYVDRYESVGIDLATQPVELAPAPHTSLGGVCVNAEGETDIEGLFACGEVTGGIHGANRLGGSAGLETLVFGRRAGQAAARYTKEAALTESTIQAPCANGTVSIAPPLQELRARMQSVLADSAGVLRTGEKLAEAMRALEAAQAELLSLIPAGNVEAFEQLRLQNDLMTALLVCTAAHNRDSSVGCHMRTDAPAPAETPYYIRLTRGADASVRVRKEEIIP